MDNLTHTLVGAALSRAGLNQKMRHASVALMIAANLPDIDIVTGAWGNLAYLQYHRGITHSMAGVTGLGLLFAGAIFFLQKRSWRRQPEALPPPSFSTIAMVCLVGTWSHLLLDFTNSYGVRPFMPFSDRWVSWDIEFIIDPLILTVLACGLVLPSLFRLISEEVGARAKARGRGGAIIALIFIVALWAVRDWNHRSALAKLSAFTYRGEDAMTLCAYPKPANPFVWTGVAETEHAYFTLEVGSNFSALTLNKAKVVYKPDDNEFLRAARETRTARIFLGFSRLPIYTVTKRGEDTLVTIQDLRFESATRRRRAFVTRILLSKDLQVLSEQFNFAG
ncbi:MAG: metal-dependent hydrolase [Acidobacteriia bacterium]|nr:metal-dependent hydrolase [Terriglobia bacterium]